MASKSAKVFQTYLSTYDPKPFGPQSPLINISHRLTQSLLDSSRLLTACSSKKRLPAAAALNIFAEFAHYGASVQLFFGDQFFGNIARKQRLSVLLGSEQQKKVIPVVAHFETQIFDTTG